MSEQRRAATLTAAYYAVLFAALGAHLPYWPVWLEDWGLSAAEIGWYVGAATIARILGTTVLAALADQYAIRRALIAWTAAAAAAIHAAHLLVETPGWLLVATVLGAVAMGPAPPVGEALGLRASAKFGFAYAPVRAIGSAGFLVANAGIGALLGQFGPDLILWTVVGGFALVAVLGAAHPGGGAAARTLDTAQPREVVRLFAIPAFLAFAVATAMGQGSHTVYYVYSVLDWRAQGIADPIIGWLWATGVAAEIVLMFWFGSRLIASLGATLALGLGALACLVRWALMAMGPDPDWLWALQAMHAITFGLAHLGAMAFFAEALPARMIGAAQGALHGAFGGLISAGLAVAAGAVAGAFGLDAAYWLAAGAAGLSLIAAAVLLRVWHGGMLLER